MAFWEGKGIDVDRQDQSIGLMDTASDEDGLLIELVSKRVIFPMHISFILVLLISMLTNKRTKES